jgi:hypothetical protein
MQLFHDNGFFPSTQATSAFQVWTWSADVQIWCIWLN